MVGSGIVSLSKTEHDVDKTVTNKVNATITLFIQHLISFCQRVRERGNLSLPVVAIGSIPYIYRRAAFPQPGDPRCLALNEGTHLLPSLATFQAEERRIAREGSSI
jgi:hypothetical protein